VQQGSALLIGTGVVRSQQRKEIALGLIGNHLDDVGQVLTFRGELDHGPLVVRMQTEFVQSQLQALSEQVKDLGEVSKAAMDSKKSSKTGGVSS
jgi:hypothetical protein